MSADTLELYRQRVLEHHRDPHNRRRPAQPGREVLAFNPLCGDKLTIYVTVDSGTVTDVAFDGTGCAISMASASMMTDALTGIAANAAEELVAEVERMFAGDDDLADPRLNDIKALESVRKYPSRIKCATLAWRAAASALQDKSEQVTTE